MKIGILTFHRAHNYGAVLQCYALQQFLISIGHKVEVIDYRQPFNEIVYAPFSIKMFLKNMIHPRGMFRYFYLYNERRKKKNIFEHFTQTYLNLSKPCNHDIPNDYDVYIIGSDQLWSLQCLGGKFDPVYLGNFHHSDKSKVYGYAISSNILSLKELVNLNLVKCVNNFTKLTMRETTLTDFFKSNLNYQLEQCVDPTLLTDNKLWNKLIIKDFPKEDYILVFQIRSPRGTNDFLYKKAKKFADNLNCKVVDLSKRHCSVEEFVTLFKFAKYVLTNSFHGTVFSIIFERPFYSVKFNDDFDGRYVDLLQRIGLESCCVNLDFIPTETKVDFYKVKELLNQYRDESIKFLLSINRI